MKISAYHKSLGDDVEWWSKDKTYDRVYSSKVFGYTPENPDLPADTIKGANRMFAQLPQSGARMRRNRGQQAARTATV